MKRNGWGLRVELAFILMFLVCLVFATIMLNRLGLLGSDGYIDNIGSGSFSYETLENKLEESAKDYVREFYNGDTSKDMVVIRYNTLYYNGYLSKLLDKNGNSCSGYVEVYKNSNSLIYFPYVKCKKYETNGYDDSKDW